MGAQSFVEDYKAKYGSEPGIYSAETFDVTEEVPGTVKTYTWSRRGELKAGSKHLFIWKWNNEEETFEMVGRVSDLVN
jgi:hypothetical protein